MKLIALCLIMTWSFNLPAQDFRPDLHSWNAVKLFQARICAFSFSSTKQERDVVYYSNLARLDGKLFIKTILMPYLQSKGNADLNKPYTNSLIADLNRLPRLKPLRSSPLLIKMAKDYAISSGLAGIIGHKNFDQRCSSLYRSGLTVGENCAYRQQNALDAVIDLLIDQNEPRLGHRHNILSPAFTKAGVGIAKHRDYDNVWIMEFSGQ